MGKILPIILALIGLGGGVGAGIMLRPESAEMVSIDPCGDMTMGTEAKHTPATDAEPKPDETAEFVKLNNQFVVPVVAKDRVSSLVVMSLSLEVDTGSQETVFQREPKIRDAFLQVLFDHANTGGFDGAFTSGGNMGVLRSALKEAATGVLGGIVRDVLIIDVVRQDA